MALFPSVSRTLRVMVRIGSEPAGNPASITLGLAGSTSNVFELTIGGTASTLGSLDVRANGGRPPCMVIVAGTPP